MSMGESDAKFPNQTGNGIPPSPTRENPGQVYPKSDPQGAPTESVPGTGAEHSPASVMGNPYAFKGALDKLDVALGEVITALRGEENNAGTSANENVLLEKFQGWRHELTGIALKKPRQGRETPSQEPGVTTQEGPMFTD